MSSAADNERNKAVILQLPELLDSPDEAIIRTLFTADFRLHDVKFPDWPSGHAGALRMFTHMKAALADIRATIEDMFGEGDKICVRWRFKGTATGVIGDRKGGALGSKRSWSAFIGSRMAALPRIGAPTSRFPKDTLGARADAPTAGRYPAGGIHNRS